MGLTKTDHKEIDMADMNLNHTGLASVAAGAARFEELRKQISDAAFHRLLTTNTEDPTDYMWIANRIKLDLASVMSADTKVQEGYFRALAAVLAASVSGFSLEVGFDALIETERAYERRTEPHPTQY